MSLNMFRVVGPDQPSGRLGKVLRACEDEGAYIRNK